jgi:G:T-mismatch repair DNA endonuclease (very short patch repair protein)
VASPADDSYFNAAFNILAMLGVDPHNLQVNYEEEVKKHGKAWVAVAIPESRVAIAVEGDNPEPLEKDGWHVSRIGLAQLKTMASVYSALNVFHFEHTRRASMAGMVKSGSKEEARLLDAILLANLEEPDRNYVIRRENGTELTTPDFTWPHLKLAFYVDGLYWHVMKDDKEIFEKIANNDEGVDKNVIINDHKTRAQKDMTNRSELQADGWRILTCSDEDLHTDEGVEHQLNLIIKLMRGIMSERKSAPQMQKIVEESETSVDEMLDLLG